MYTYSRYFIERNAENAGLIRRMCEIFAERINRRNFKLHPFKMLLILLAGTTIIHTKADRLYKCLTIGSSRQHSTEPNCLFECNTCDILVLEVATHVRKHNTHFKYNRCVCVYIHINI